MQGFRHGAEGLLCRKYAALLNVAHGYAVNVRELAYKRFRIRAVLCELDADVVIGWHFPPPAILPKKGRLRSALRSFLHPENQEN